MIVLNLLIPQLRVKLGEPFCKLAPITVAKGGDFLFDFF